MYTHTIYIFTCTYMKCYS